jgi:hypothetical protein
MSKHARSWFHNVATYNEEVIEYFTKKFSENSFQSKLEKVALLVLLESP